MSADLPLLARVLAGLAVLRRDHEVHLPLADPHVEQHVLEQRHHSGRHEHVRARFADDPVLLRGLTRDLELQRCAGARRRLVWRVDPQARALRPEPSGISAFATMDLIARPALSETMSIGAHPLFVLRGHQDLSGTTSATG
jgi:hypothetical protein